jgi:AraC-like DNA-binding protein
MPSSPDQATPSALRFSTDDVARPARLKVWRELFERWAVRADVEPLSIDQFSATALLEALPGLSVMSFVSTPMRMVRTAQMLDDGDDALVLLTPQDGWLTMAQRGREVTVGPGEAVLALHGEPAVLSHSDVRFRGLVVPRKPIAGALRNMEHSTMRHISANEPALRLLLYYVSGISPEMSQTSNRAGSVVGSHVHDLIALVASQGAEASRARTGKTMGVRAARFAAIKADIIAHLGDPEVTIDGVAARQRVTPRTVQRLFEEENSTFSRFKLEHQLFYARRLLGADRIYPTIADIAYAAGFSDLSYFHHSFRRRFGITPAEYRANNLLTGGAAVRGDS